MSVLGEVVELLKRRDVWKRIEEGPKRIELERRVAELEQRLQRAPGEACPKCGALSYRVDRSEKHLNFVSLGGRVHQPCAKDCALAPSRKSRDSGRLEPGKATRY
jgi:hypothetical protein